jgi:hypothetical protein
VDLGAIGLDGVAGVFLHPVVEPELHDLVDLAAQDKLDPEAVAVAGGDVGRGEQAGLHPLLDRLHLEVAVPGDHGAGDLAGPPDDRIGRPSPMVGNWKSPRADTVGASALGFGRRTS